MIYIAASIHQKLAATDQFGKMIMSNFRVTCKVPTTYQYSSITKLMGWAEKSWDGSFSAIEEAETEEEAKEFLRQRLHQLWLETGLTQDEYDEKLADIEMGYLEYDAAMAHIEKAEKKDD